ncbi:hypothetical protein JCM19233_2020 [Vibrio astriarenae]|nr:hypothetical protein JCM19233_2020 [Vibrio sp. C7]
MNYAPVLQLKRWLKESESPTAKTLFQFAKTVRVCDIRYPSFINSALYATYTFARDSWSNLVRVLIQTPAFRGRVSNAVTNSTCMQVCLLSPGL